MLPHLTVTALALAALGLALLYKLILHPLFISPLRRIPAAHPTARFSSLWILWVRYYARENRTVHAAHVKYGPVILLGPREISVNCVEGGIRSVYGGNWEKDEWYAFFANYGSVQRLPLLFEMILQTCVRIVYPVAFMNFLSYKL